MNVDTSIGSLRASYTRLTGPVQSRLTSDGSRWVKDGTQRARAALAAMQAYLRSKAPIVIELWEQTVKQTRRTRDWIRGIDFGARTVQAVGAAVVVGTLYVAIWGTGPNPVPESPEVVAARIAPIGTLTLNAIEAPKVAEQAPAQGAAASSL
jgi:isochorismate hydrolase